MNEYSQSLQGFIELVKRGNYLVLDTETTGLGDQAEICQIAVIDDQGQTLLDTFVKPTRPIPSDATVIHGITDEMVSNAMGWKHIGLELALIIARRDVIIYNANYDLKMMRQSGEAAGVHTSGWGNIATFHCAMNTFAEVYGDWNYRYSSWKWKPLATACYYYDIPVTSAHTALGDCRMTLAVAKKIAGVSMDDEDPESPMNPLNPYDRNDALW
jgi:DNA polymerase III epsilon subunit-like protein